MGVSGRVENIVLLQQYFALGPCNCVSKVQ